MNIPKIVTRDMAISEIDMRYWEPLSRAPHRAGGLSDTNTVYRETWELDTAGVVLPIVRCLSETPNLPKGRLSLVFLCNMGYV